MYGEYVYARLAHHDEQDLNTAELGDIRVKWQMVVCSDVTFISQQMQNGEGEFTFRNWNPDKEDVPWGESTAQDVDVSCPGYCLPCFIVECLFKAVFQETIDYVRGGLHKMEACFDTMEEENQSSTVFIRWLAWGMNVLGNILIWYPFIKLLSWIPLVGGLLAGILLFAVIVWSLVWGTLTHLLIMTVAWIVYRPLFGLLLLSGVALLLAVTFMYPAPKEKVD